MTRAWLQIRWGRPEWDGAPGPGGRSVDGPGAHATEGDGGQALRTAHPQGAPISWALKARLGSILSIVAMLWASSLAFGAAGPDPKPSPPDDPLLLLLRDMESRPLPPDDPLRLTADELRFLEDLKCAVESNDAQWISRNIWYRFHILHKGKWLYLKSPDVFLRYYDVAFNDYVKKSIKAATPENVVKNWMGIRIGTGAIWISTLGDSSGKKDTDETRWRVTILKINNWPTGTLPKGMISPDELEVVDR